MQIILSNYNNDTIAFINLLKLYVSLCCQAVEINFCIYLGCHLCILLSVMPLLASLK